MFTIRATLCTLSPCMAQMCHIMGCSMFVHLISGIRLEDTRCVAGLAWDPKYSHLKELHRAIKSREQSLVSSDPTVTTLGKGSRCVTLHFVPGMDNLVKLCPECKANYHYIFIVEHIQCYRHAFNNLPIRLVP